MPKERFHMLLAEEAAAFQTTRGFSRTPVENHKDAYLLGAVSPDIFFYRLPTFSLSRYGGSIHRLQGEACMPAFKLWLNQDIPGDLLAWCLGAASHFLADGLFHPVIQALCDPPSDFHSYAGLTPGQCHHWIESELEAYWLQKKGPPHRYLPLLRRIQADVQFTGRYIHHYRHFLAGKGFEPVPGRSAMRSCMNWQAFLLGQFSHPLWLRMKPLLLRMRISRSLGVLVVPSAPVLRHSLESYRKTHAEIPDLCGPEFFRDAVIFLADRLIELQERS